MKNLVFVLLIITISGFLLKQPEIKSKNLPEYRNFYGIAWNGTPSENLAYAQQMGYDYVFYQKGMELDKQSIGLYFYIETPEYSVYPRSMDTKKVYPEKEIRFFETNYALISLEKQFPFNIARGWYMANDVFTPQLDFQQQKVILWAVDSILCYVKSIEMRNNEFKFGGFAWDVPQPAGDFWDTIQNPGRQVTLAHWTGGDFGIKHPDVTHNYPTYSDGRIEFYKTLYRETRKVYPHARFIMEPYRIYEDWIQVVEGRHDAKEVTPDMLVQERYGTEFVNDGRIFASGLINKENVGSTTPDRFGDFDNRQFAANAAVHGAWFSWYGRFGGTGDMPKFKSVTEIPARLKLIRVLANWENKNQTPMISRKWDGEKYSSPNAYADSTVIFIKHPSESLIFFVFQTETGRVTLDKMKRITDIFTTDDLFRKTGSAMSQFTISENSISPNDNSMLGKGYILQYR
jgi:hypothetical protein